MALKILWLCSWYPNETDPYYGGFIKRHAEAVSNIHSIDVLYVHKCNNSAQLPEYKKNICNEHLTEHIFTNPVSNENFFSTFLGLMKFFLIHRQFIRKNGRPDLIHVHIPMKSGLVALFYKCVYHIPYIVTEHYGIYNPFLHDHFKTRSFFYRYATKLILKHASAMTTVSKSLGDDINHWVLQKEFTVIPNVVDTNLFHFEEQVSKEKFQFIHISNMIPLKNVQGIIEATEILWRERTDFKMVFAGRIVNTFYELAISKELLNKVIFFEGEIPYNEVSTKIKESEALIIFSDTESQSCVVLESLCCGRPAIVTNIGGVKELVDEENGYKINVRDTNDLVNKMREMINHYTSFNLKNISAKATNIYSYESVAKQFDECYAKVLKY